MIQEYAPYFIIGIATGSIYAIAAMGLVLTYKTSGIFNFGHGAVGAAAAFLFYELHITRGLAWPLAAVITVFVFGAVAGLLLELVGRGLATVTPAMKIVGTLGILLAVQGLAVLRYGITPLPLQQFLPQQTFRVAGVFVGVNQLIVALLALGAAVGLYYFFRLTRTGTAMRAVVDDADLLDMTGISPVRVRRTAWVLGSMFAALAGILIAPLLQLDATVLTLLIVQAFGAAAIGRFTSLPLTYVGGLVLGVLRELTGKWVGSNETLSALPTAVPFLMLFVVLLFTPKGKLPDFGRLVRARVRPVRTTTRSTRLAVYAALAVAVVLPLVVGTKTILFTTALVYVGVFLSLGMLTRLSGMVSLCQIGLMAVGAAIFGQLQGSAGVPWLIALVLAGLLTVPFGAVVAIPAIRLSGLYLALATFGYGILLEQILYRASWLFGNSAGVQAGRPEFLGISFAGDRAYYYVVLTISALMALGVAAIERARLGRLLHALGDSPRALSTGGTSINITRVIVFCIAAFLAGVSGALYVPLFGTVNGDTFPAFLSLILLAVFAVAGSGVVRPAFVAAIVYFVVPGYVDSSTLVTGLPAIFGLAAIVVALTSNGGGPAAWAARLTATSGWRTLRSPVRERMPQRAARSSSRSESPTAPVRGATPAGAVVRTQA